MQLNLSRLMVISMLAFGFTATSHAQQPGDTTSRGMNTYEDTRDGTQWGWLGLTGLVGLAGLMRRESRQRPLVRSEATATR